MMHTLRIPDIVYVSYTIYWMSSHQNLIIRLISIYLIVFQVTILHCLYIVSANIYWGKRKFASSFVSATWCTNTVKWIISLNLPNFQDHKSMQVIVDVIKKGKICQSFSIRLFWNSGANSYAFSKNHFFYPTQHNYFFLRASLLSFFKFGFLLLSCYSFLQANSLLGDGHKIPL